MHILLYYIAIYFYIVGNIAYKYTEEQLRGHFEQVGPVLSFKSVNYSI